MADTPLTPALIRESRVLLEEQLYWNVLRCANIIAAELCPDWRYHAHEFVERAMHTTKVRITLIDVEDNDAEHRFDLPLENICDPDGFMYWAAQNTDALDRSEDALRRELCATELKELLQTARALNMDVEEIVAETAPGTSQK